MPVKGYKGHQVGSRKERAHQLFDALGPEKARPKVEKMGIKPSTVSTWFSRFHAEGAAGTARVFMHGRSQAVRLPKEFRLPGDRVRVRRVAKGILLEPILSDADTWFAEMDKYRAVDFMPHGREQPSMPEEKNQFE